MFDISWTEFLLIGVVALIVIGPKELPGVMRTMGQWTRKIRGMATDFQNQFHEAMREAEMADLKKQVDDLAEGVTKDFSNLDPLKTVRDDVENMGKDIEKSLATNPEGLSPESAAVETPAVEQPALGTPVSEPLALEPPATEQQPDAAAPAGPASSAPTAAEREVAGAPGSSERAG
jgi:sec-independent protein translocase protein TatB